MKIEKEWEEAETETDSKRNKAMGVEDEDNDGKIMHAKTNRFSTQKMFEGVSSNTFPHSNEDPPSN
ncbi:hypothetical protein YC2023_122230 [Brassica napus]